MQPCYGTVPEFLCRFITPLSPFVLPCAFNICRLFLGGRRDPRRLRHDSQNLAFVAQSDVAADGLPQEISDDSVPSDLGVDDVLHVKEGRFIGVTFIHNEKGGGGVA